MCRAGICCLLLSLIVSAAQETPVAQVAQALGRSGRSVVVLSDLHMGVGRDGAGAYSPFEHFRWSSELGAFLQAVDRQGEGRTDLIFNGDTFELLQSTGKDCTYADADLGCTEGEALARLERVLTAHDAEIKMLGQLARTGANHVVFVPGDHDAALLFPSVGSRVVRALGAPAGRVEVAASGSWRSADGRIYAEHGQQIGLSVERFDNWPQPFIRRSGRQHLARPWGQQVTEALLSRLQARYPVLEHVAEAGIGLKYVLSPEGGPEIRDGVPDLVRYLLFKMSWQQFRQDLDGGDVQPPVWDIVKVRAQGPAFLVSSVLNDDPLKPLAAQALEDHRLDEPMKRLTDEEIVALCDYRAAVRRARRRMERVLTQLEGQGPAVAECPRTPDTMGSVYEYFWRTRDAVFNRRIEEVNRAGSAPQPIAVFVHGHTHLADRSQVGSNAINGDFKIVPEGFSPVRGAFTPIAINDGAWQRTITPVQLQALQKDRGRTAQDLLKELQPEQLPPCYSFVDIRPYTDAPAPAVRYWRPADTGSWEIGTSCGRGGAGS
jgi:hypothetical protein